jgi:hypothetical protein
MKKKLYNSIDHKLFEELGQKYTPSELLNAIEEIKAKQQNEVQETSKLSEREQVLEFIKKLEGYRVRLREIHWNTTNKSEHELTDSLMSSLTSFEDEIAEAAMGVFGFRISVGDVVPILPEEVEVDPIIASLRNLTISLKQVLTKSTIESEFHGINAILDDIMKCLDKGRYLKTLN